MINIPNDKYTRLLEDYTELKQTNEDCEKEYLRIYKKLIQIKELLQSDSVSKNKNKNKSFIINQIKKIVVTL